MIRESNRQLMQMADSLEELATMICGHGFYAYHKDDCEHPIPKDAVREYLEVGAAFQLKETEPKLQKLKKLADAMYHAAQYLNTDASHLRKTMDEYHQFVIQNKI